VLAQPRRELVEVEELAERHAELEETEVVDRKQRLATLVVPVAADHSFDRVVVGDERREL
jgi:hypothetical protein